MRLVALDKLPVTDEFLHGQLKYIARNDRIVFMPLHDIKSTLARYSTSTTKTPIQRKCF